MRRPTRSARGLPKDVVSRSFRELDEVKREMDETKTKLKATKTKVKATKTQLAEATRKFEERSKTIELASLQQASMWSRIPVPPTTFW